MDSEWAESGNLISASVSPISPQSHMTRVPRLWRFQIDTVRVLPTPSTTQVGMDNHNGVRGVIKIMQDICRINAGYDNNNNNNNKAPDMRQFLYKNTRGNNKNT